MALSYIFKNKCAYKQINDESESGKFQAKIK